MLSTMALLSLCVLVVVFPVVSGEVARPSFPLTAKGLHVVDSAGVSFQFRCANWPGHMESMLPEGIQWTSLDDIVALIVSSNVYNCIRLTYAADMWSTVDKSTTARQALMALNLSSQVTAVTKYNPDLIDLPLIDIQTRVVQACNKANIVVLFDNQVSKPMWCCSYTDGNGWWGDQYFNVQSWVTALSAISTHYKNSSLNTPNAVAFSLRNELRNDVKSRAEQVIDWYQYVAMGIEAIHTASPSALVFVSGINYDCDFAYLKDSHVHNKWDELSANLTSNLVFEAHIYEWSGYGNFTPTCQGAWDGFDGAIGWPYQNNRPLVLTEMGLVTSSYPHNADEAAYWTCVTGFC